MRGWRSLFMASLLAGAALIAPPAAAQAPEKVLKVIPSADLTQLDPVFVPIVITRIYGLMIYDQLFSWDHNLQPKPQMVESWKTSPDGLTWSFTLRPKLAFHDGQKVTTADVVASLERWMKRDVVGQKLGSFTAGIDAVNAETFEIRLKRPYPLMLVSLGSAIGQIPIIMRAKDLTGDPGKPVTTSIGSGPFIFDKEARISGALTVFRRNPAYVPRSEPADGLAGGKVAKVDRVEWHVMPDAATASAALQAGEMDIWEQPAFDLLPLLRKNKGIRIQPLTTMANQGMLRPNSLYPPFNDPRARLALAYIINQDDIMTAAFGDKPNWSACWSYFICGGPYGSLAGTQGLKQDIPKAKQLLAEAGYKGETLVFPSTHQIAPIGNMAEVIADELKKAGVNVEIIWADWGTTASRQSNQGPPSKGGWNLINTYASGPTMYSPLTNIGTNMVCNRQNFAGWPCDEHAEKLREAFVVADDAHRKEALDALHAYLAKVQPYTVLGQFAVPVAFRADVKGVLNSPVMTYWNISKQ